MTNTVRSRIKVSLKTLLLYAGLFCLLFSVLGAAVCITGIHFSGLHTAVKLIIYLFAAIVYAGFGLVYGIMLWTSATLSRALEFGERTARQTANAAGILAGAFNDGTAAGTMLTAVINGLLIAAALLSARKMAWAGTQLAALKFLLAAIRAVLHIIALLLLSASMWAML